MMQGMGPMAAAGGWANRPVQQGLMFSHESSQPAHPLQISWQDGRFPANFINASNVLEYFSNQFNPFYDRTCNNETVKMQRLPVEQIMKMVGIEYALLHCSEPLFVIRKQKRHNPTQVTPIAEYYIIGGTVYQAPDLCSVINSRMVTALNYIRAAFDEAHNCSRYHPSKGYWWEFKGHTSKQVEKKERVEVRSTAFQRSRVDPLLDLLTRKFPPPEIEGEHNNLKLPLPSQTVGNVPDDAGFETGASVQNAPSNRAPKKTSPQPSDNEPPAKRLKTEP